MPPPAQAIGVRGRHGRLEPPLGAPLLCDLFRRSPEPDGESRQVGRADGRRLGHRWPYDGHPEQVGLELHEHVVAGGASVDAQFGKRDARVAMDGIEQVADLIGDALEGGPREVSRVRSPRQADDGAAGVRVPMRRAEARERRHEIHAAVVWHGGRKRLDVQRTA